MCLGTRTSSIMLPKWETTKGSTDAEKRVALNGKN